MNVEKITKKKTVIAVVTDENKLITDCQSALDLVMTAKYETGTKNIAVDKNCVADEFFVLSTGLAGEILQKFVNYGVRCAIYGDYSHYTSKPLRDFIYESNSGRDIFFVETKDKAIDMLTK